MYLAPSYVFKAENQQGTKVWTK